MKDTMIAALFRARSEDAIRETERQYGALCLRLARNLLQNEEDARECVNDAYLALWNSLAGTEPGNLRAYICRVVRNTACGMLRKRTAQKRDPAKLLPLEELEAVLPSSVDPTAAVDAAELTAALNRFTHSLPERQRYIFLRRYYHCESVGEIADALGTTESTVSVALHRLRQKLKKELEKEGFPV